MFAQMKSRSRGGNSGESTKDDNILILKTLMFLFVFIIVFTAIWWNVSDHHPPTVMVGGKQCELHFVVTGRTSWGSVRGHYKTVCPNNN